MSREAQTLEQTGHSSAPAINTGPGVSREKLPNPVIGHSSTIKLVDFENE